MKQLLTSLLFLFLGTSLVAQNSSEENEVQRAIETFFEGFHARDSTVMKKVLHDDIVVQTIGRSKSGKDVLVQEEIGKVLKAIVSIPSGTSFKETINEYVIKVDGSLANAWTPYSFHLNENFSHCGVNNFQLFKDNGQWKIIYLIDTRRRDGCNPEKE